MVLETAQINLKPGAVDDFLSVLPAGIKILQQAKGFIGISVQTGIERSDVVLLTIQWETLENHTKDFRESELFAQWREVISPYFVTPPLVEHWSVQTQFAN